MAEDMHKEDRVKLCINQCFAGTIYINISPMSLSKVFFILITVMHLLLLSLNLSYTNKILFH